MYVVRGHREGTLLGLKSAQNMGLIEYHLDGGSAGGGASRVTGGRALFSVFRGSKHRLHGRICLGPSTFSSTSEEGQAVSVDKRMSTVF